MKGKGKKKPNQSEPQIMPGLNFPVRVNFYDQIETETPLDEDTLAQGEKADILKLNESSIKNNEDQSPNEVIEINDQGDYNQSAVFAASNQFITWEKPKSANSLDKYKKRPSKYQIQRNMNIE